MTKFDKTKFTTGEYTMYEGKFVARFKRGHRGSFLTFLVKHFTVEEYFEMYEVKNLAPLTILETKGYLHPNAKKYLKLKGLPLTLEAFKQSIRDEVEARNKARTVA